MYSNVQTRLGSYFIVKTWRIDDQLMKKSLTNTLGFKVKCSDDSYNGYALFRAYTCLFAKHYTTYVLDRYVDNIVEFILLLSIVLFLTFRPFHFIPETRLYGIYMMMMTGTKMSSKDACLQNMHNFFCMNIVHRKITLNFSRRQTVICIGT